MVQGLRLQKLGITNKSKTHQSPCWILSAGAKLGIIMLSVTVSSTIIIVAGKSLTMKQEAIK